jgi:alpha-amylase/alpha-mannosidase (GH57 family)
MLALALLWHQHQPVYRDGAHPTPTGSYRQPWVRLHAIRDYYSMAALVAEHPDLRLTINLTPVLLRQLEDYTARGATDWALDLTRKPAEELSAGERERLLGGFFDAAWHTQNFPHPRYKELFARRQDGQAFAARDLRDLQMWATLAWFGQEFRDGAVALPTGEVASVRRFVAQGRDFAAGDIAAMLAEQDKILRAVVPIHRLLQERGQIEVATSPYAHPILPLLADTDRATIDRPGAAHPPRFAWPEDAEAQVRLAVACYRHHFGRAPRGMWPAEGAVAQFVLPHFARHGIRWLATDRGVLARSGRWGYDADDPDVLCRPYRAEEGERAVSLFFRDTALSDAIGFRYQAYADPMAAAGDFLRDLKARFAPAGPAADRVVTVALDGENAWGAYREDARPFLHALYGLLVREPAIRTVTFGEYLEGNPARGIAPHPMEEQRKVYDLFTGSWIDELGSAPGVDLGTWVGEPEENRAWQLLGAAREALARSGSTPEIAPDAYDTLYLAEGSDWFWWFGDDQDAGNDAEFDDLFRTHLRNVYRGLGQRPPAELDGHIVPHHAVWTFAQPVARIQPGDRLTVRANCPGTLTWRAGDAAPRVEDLAPVGGVMAGVRRYQLALGPAPPGVRTVRFRFRCAHPGCDGRDICCSREEHVVEVADTVG